MENIEGKDLQQKEKIFFHKIITIYEKFTLFLYRIIKCSFFQKFLLLFILISSIALCIATLVLGLNIYPYNWYINSALAGFLTIPLFFIPLSIFFLKNLDLFDYFLERVFNFFIKPWLLPFIIVLFSFGFYFIYSRLNLPNFTYFLVILPIFPIYVVKIIFEMFISPTGYSSLTWAIFFNVILIIPLIIYFFNFIGKKILSKIEILSEDSPECLSLKELETIKPEKNDLNFKKELIIIWFVSAIICFFTLVNANFGWDTPNYYIFVKDYFETGNLDLIFNPSLKRIPITDYSFQKYYSILPIVYLLIFFTTICGGDLIFGSLIMHTVLFSIAPPLIILITKNITGNFKIAKWAGILYLFSGPIQILLTGIMNQLLHIDLILISMFLLSYKFKNKLKRYIATFTVFLLIIFQSIFYIFILGLMYYISLQYILRKQKINFIFLKNPKIYQFIKIGAISLFFGFIIFFFIFGFKLDVIFSIFRYPLEFFKFQLFYNPQSDSNIINSSLNLTHLGISIFFIIIGIYIDLKEKIINHPKFRIYLILFLESTAIFIFLDLFGIKFIAERWISFIPIVGSIFGAIGIMEIKKIFPRIWIKIPHIQKFIEISLISSLIVCYPLGISQIRNAYIVQEELEALNWFKTRSDYPKLINEHTTDIQIICNYHLKNWAKYYIHYNIFFSIYGLDDLSSLMSVKYFSLLRAKAQEKLYIFISNNKDPSNETWTMEGLINTFNEYKTIYPFNWINYTINDLVVIWEINYIN